MKASEFILSEGGGYIPKNAEEARDPRWMMAITNDIKPGETQRQAAKMGFKTDKEGRPPLLKANGKLSENVVWMNDEMPCPHGEPEFLHPTHHGLPIGRQRMFHSLP